MEVEMWLAAVSVARCADEADQMVRRSDGRQWSGEPIDPRPFFTSPGGAITLAGRYPPKGSPREDCDDNGSSGSLALIQRKP